MLNFKNIWFSKSTEVGLVALEVFFHFLNGFAHLFVCLLDGLEISRAVTVGNITRCLYCWDFYTAVSKFSHMRKSLLCPVRKSGNGSLSWLCRQTYSWLAARVSCNEIKSKPTGELKLIFFPLIWHTDASQTIGSS